MAPTTTTVRSRRGLAVLGVAALAVVAIGGSVTARTSTQAPAVSAVTSPAATMAPGDEARSAACGTRRMRDAGWPGMQHRPGTLGMRCAERRRGRAGWRQGRLERRQGRLERPAWVGVASQGGRVATITAIDGTSVTLVTPDGWTRTIDVTGIPVMRGDTTITAADLQVGTRVRVTQRRADDDTWEVTRIRVLPTTTRGTVASVRADGFDVTTGDGSVVTVHVSETTTWATGWQVTGGLDALRVGSPVLVRGFANPDGSLEASTVATAGERVRRHMHGRRPAPMASQLPIPSPEPSAPAA